MKILYYTWNENSRDDMLQTLQFLGHEVEVCDMPCQDYEQDKALSAYLEKIIGEQSFDIIFSFNFLPVIAKAAGQCRIKYISWIYDCPHWTLFSPAVRSAYNYIFVFDRLQYQQLQALGAEHCYHFPLAVNTARLSRLLAEEQEEKSRADVSFVGSLYENNLYDRLNYLPDYIRGYLSGIIEAQERIYGYNFVGELLTDEIIGEMNKFISMDLPRGYYATKRELYAEMLNGKITANERLHLLAEASKRFCLTIYTASDTATLPQAIKGGIVDYVSQMPVVFHNSQINLNMSLRSIQSGIPLRALDIMGAGGFLLSNYQPELAEYFEDGKELALFGSAQEMMEKAAYYLAHEEERRQIAAAGLRKVRELFSYEVRVGQMLEMVNQ